MSACLSDERHVHLALLNQCPTPARGALHDLDGDTSELFAEPLEQVGQKDEGQADADGELAVLAALHGSSTLHGTFEVLDALGGLLEESIARGGWTYARVSPLKEFRSKSVFEASHASAYRGLLDVECRGRPPEAAVLSRSQSILK